MNEPQRASEGIGVLTIAVERGLLTVADAERVAHEAAVHGLTQAEAAARASLLDRRQIEMLSFLARPREGRIRSRGQYAAK